MTEATLIFTIAVLVLAGFRLKDALEHRKRVHEGIKEQHDHTLVHSLHFAQQILEWDEYERFAEVWGDRPIPRNPWEPPTRLSGTMESTGFTYGDGTPA
jgi:hypothetical protein